MVSSVLVLSGCLDDAAKPAPEPPATLERPSRLPWGDRDAARLERLAGHIHDQMRQGYSSVRETYYVARSPAAAAELESWYRARLGDEWLHEQVSLPPGESGFAFTAGKQALVVGWLDPLTDGRVPVVIMRYGDGRRRR